MKTMNRYILSIIALLTIAVLSPSDSPALVNMSLTEQGGHTNLERNSSYSVDCKLTPDGATDISQVYAYIKYRKAIFTDVTMTNNIAEVCPITWETSYTNVAFEDDGTWITAQYLMANTEGPDWSAEAETYLIYTLNFKIKTDASLESTNVNFTQSATISDDEGGNVTGTVYNYSFTVVLDSTPPVTSAAPPGGYYNTDRNVTLSINEAGTISYKIGVGSYTEYASAIPLTGATETVTTHDLYFYGLDEPVGKSPNQESANLETYYIDKEDPITSNIEADPEMIGMGGSVDITFDVADLSGALGNEGQPDYVRLGGRGAYWVSGTDAGSFTYRITVNGEESDGDIVVMVTDAAGNFSIQTEADTVSYDLEGPTFTITPGSDLIYLEELLNMTVTASETLSAEKPDVTVGGQEADYDHHNGLEYTYTYLMTSRNWEADFGFLDLEGDKDGDGLPNWWEDNYDLSKTSAVGDNGATGDPDGDGWNNLAEYQFYQIAGKLVDPKDSSSGGQAIPLHVGWNLIGYTVNTSWYEGDNAPENIMTGVTKTQVEGNSWANFYNNSRFKDSSGNFISSMVRHPDGEWKYYGQFQPDWRNSQDYQSPDQGLWINMAQVDTLILEGPRVSGSTYPAIGLKAGWNLVNILPRTCYYTEVYSHAPESSSDVTASKGYSTVQEMLKAAFNLSDTDFNKIEGIQIMYSAPYGVCAYDKSVDWWFWTLKFVQPGYGAWIKLEDGAEINLQYQEP